MEGDVTSKTEYKPDLAALKRMFTEAQTDTYESRRDSQIDDDYYHGYQLTSEERRALQARKQPDIVFNRIRPAVNGTLGVIKQGATDPKAYPRNPDDEQSADVASKVLRFIADKSNFDALKIDAAKNYLVEGTCAVIIEAEGEDIPLTPIRWEEFFYDPRSRRQDFSDARFMGIAKWQYADEVGQRYPDAKKDVELSLEGSPSIDDTFEDRPSNTANTVAWTDGKKRRVMVVEIYHKEGGAWYRCVFHSGGVLESGESPYLDEKGRPSCPIEAQSCFVDRENNRYGIVRDMRGPQDEINKRRSKLLHLVTVRQVQESAPGAAMGQDADEAKKQAALPDGALPPGWQIVPTADLARGQAELLAESKAEIERMGPNPAILGRQGESQSGRANLVRQQAGLTEQAIIFGGIEEWELRVYRQMWARARQYWKAPMWVRVTDDMGAPEFVQVNKPGPPQIGMGPGGTPAIMPGQVENEIASLDVDIILDTTPDTANVQQEQFQMLTELAKVGALGPNAGQLLLEASSLPNKAQVLEKLKGDPEQSAMQQQQAQKQAAIAERGAMAKIADTEASAAKKAAETQDQKVETGLKVQSAMAGFGPMPAQGPPPGF